MSSCNNIFFEPFKTTNGAIPFDRITTDLYEPAILEAMKRHSVEIEAIANQQAEPTFDNTIVALEHSGQMLNRVLNVFYPMLSANADDELMEISQRLAPKMAEHSNNITLNHKLWQRIDYVFNHFDKASHDQEDWMLLEKTHELFVRSGAALEGSNRDKYRELSTRLSQLSLKFDQNALKETSQYEMWLNESDLDGLPESAVEAAEAAARGKNREGEYLITLQAPSYMPFMKYSARRDLREKLYLMFNKQCTSGDYCNIEILQQIASTRLELAKLLGYETFAHYQLDTKMAEKPENVYNMLYQLKDAYIATQRSDMDHLNAYASKLEGKQFTIMPWDYAYYANKLREERYSINDELLRPYFELSNVIEGVFGLATRLYGLHFTENHDAQVFNPEVKVYDVTDHDGNFMALLYTDFFPRDTKQSGAWMTNFREQYHDAQGNDVRPIVTLTMNFTRPTETKPSLLTYGEVRTFLHEFGHGLHSMLSKCKYASTSGTNVYRDFVELPSQFNENFLSEREFLDSFARHYVTGEKIPQELIDRIKASAQFGAAYACLRQLSFGLLDMAYHTITEPVEGDAFEFEHKAMEPVQMFAPVDGCMMSSHFTHIFSGGYAAGYYGYKWAEILDADAFSKFQEDGIFNPETARSFKENILERGGTEPPMTLYKRFRGREPKIDALLKRDGIKK